MVTTVKNLFRKAKNYLFTNPSLLYKEERRLVSQPFYFEGTNGRAVLLIHGWTTVPYEVRRLGQYLNENGYTVYAPMLSGHGTVPKDLEGLRWHDWLNDVRKAYKRLKTNYEKVYVGGTSIGSNLAIMLAAENKSIAGLILMATPYKLRFEKFVILFAKFLRLFKKYTKKHYPPTFGISTTITRIISYQTYPIDSALETFYLIQKSRERLDKIIQPCFILQSSSDHIAVKNSLEKIYNKVSSKVKRKMYIKRAYHTFISDIKNEYIFKEILKFLNDN